MRASVVKVSKSLFQTPAGLRGASFLGFAHRSAHRPRNMHVRTRGKYSVGGAKLEDHLWLPWLDAEEEARRSVPSVNSGESMLVMCDRKRLRQGAAASGAGVVFGMMVMRV
jgi:hypothetical protein